MEASEQTIIVLQNILQGVLSPVNETRKEAEAYLKNIESQPGFLLVVLHYINLLSRSQVPQECAIRQTASVIFKNAIKRRWVPDDENESSIADTDRENIKIHLIDLMCSTPQDVQRQLSEAVSIISTHDFPQKWVNLIPQLCNKLATQDFLVIKGVMLTGNSIFKRFRFTNKSDALYADLILCLKEFNSPLIEMYCAMGMAVENYNTDKEKLAILFETLRLMTRIFYSLNWQDLPEFYEDNMSIWMREFSKYLAYKNPLLVDDREEPGPVEKLQAAIIENLNLYASKYEEEFSPHLSNFTQAVWQLLINVGPEPKLDILATNGIKFITAVSSKECNKNLFGDDVLRSIVEQIVVKNIMSLETDEELFEDNPQDFIRKDFEGNDQDTRRRCACELVRSLLKFFPSQITNLCLGYIAAMLEDYNKLKNWHSKDAALHLVLAVSAISISSVTGVGEINPAVNVMDIFNSHVLPEILDSDVNVRPIVKADCIKLICLFRSHLGLPFMLNILPHITRHLTSKIVVIQTYAAICIEKFLSVKEKLPTGESVTRITKVHLSALLNDIFHGLFLVLDNPELPENDYVMKCIMRVLVIIGIDVGPVIPLLMNKLNSSLERVCKNPVNPLFNHYLFECLAILVKSCCSIPNPELVLNASKQLEELLFPPFQAVLTMDVEEFIPYVFQVLAEMLYYRPLSELSDAYKGLFGPILSPILWERKGNVPALTELLKAYLVKSMPFILSNNQLEAVLGIFQKNLASKATETYAFEILNQIYSSNDSGILKNYTPTIFQLLFRRMMENKTPQYIRCFSHSIFLFSSKFGGQSLYESCETIQPEMTALIITKIIEPNLQMICDVDTPHLSRIIVGSTKLLCDSSMNLNPSVWTILYCSIIDMMMIFEKKKSGVSDKFVYEDENAESREFDNTFSKLVHAHLPDFPLSVEETQPVIFFLKSLANLCQIHPGRFNSIIFSCLQEEPALFFKSKLQQFGISL